MCRWNRQVLLTALGVAVVVGAVEEGSVELEMKECLLGVVVVEVALENK